MFSILQVIFGLAMLVVIVAIFKPSLFHSVYSKLNRKHALIALAGLLIFTNSPVGKWMSAHADAESKTRDIARQEASAKRAQEKAKEEAEKAEKDAQKAKEDAAANQARIKDMLTIAIETVAKFPKPGTDLRENGINGIDAELLLFQGWASMIAEARATKDPELEGLATKLEKRVSQIQVQEFPLLRKAFAKNLDDKGWEHDLDASAYGSGNKTLELVNAAFAANKNIAQIHSSLESKLKMLRFTRVNYKWYSGASEWQYFNLETPKDSEVALNEQTK